MVVLMAVETHEFLRIAHPRVQDLPATDSFTRKRPSSVIGEKCGLAPGTFPPDLQVLFKERADALNNCQSLLDVGLNVCEIFNAARNANEAVSDTQRGPFFRTECPMG